MLWLLSALAALLATDLLFGLRLSRWCFAEVVSWFVRLEMFCIQWVRRLYPPKYSLGGECIRCGRCCEQIVSNPPRWFREKGWRLYAAFHRSWHRFELVARGDQGEFLFRCGHLQSDGRCGNYRHRPLICRTYPVQPYFEAPNFIPGCSHTVVPRVLAHKPNRSSLTILNPTTATHHPTPIDETHLDLREHYERVEHPLVNESATANRR